MSALPVRSRALAALLVLTLAACFPEGITNAGKKAQTAAANTVPARTAPVASASAPVPSIIVKDHKGKPVAGVVVTFAVTAGGGTITGATQTTDIKGIAAVGGWTYGRTAGEQRLSAKPDLIAEVPFVVTATAGAPSQLTKVSGDAQTATVGSAVATPVTVGVKDAYGNAVSGATVTFAPTNGSSVAPASAATNSSGLATTQWTMATTPGGASLTASLGNLTPVTFSATAVHGPAVTPTKLGDGQSGTVGTVLAQAVGVSVKDSYGNAVAGIPVTFTPANGSSVNPATVNTDAQGTATTLWKMATVSGPMSLNASVGTFSVPFVATALAGAPARLVQLSYPSTSTVGANLNNVGVTVVDSYGNPVSGAAVTFTPANQSGVWPATANSDQSGNALTRWTMGTSMGTMTMTASATGVSSSAFSVYAAAGPAFQLVKQQEAFDGAPGSSQSLGIYVRDYYGNPAAGETVTFTPANGSSVNPAAPASNASGLAATSWTFGPTSGTQSVTASLGTLTPQTFTATVTAPPPPPPDPCASKGTLPQPGSVAGDLSTSQCVYDSVNGSFIDLWTLTLTGSKPMEITHKTDGVTMDPYMLLYRGTYTGTQDAIAYNDDGFTSCCDSRIRFLGGAGTFLVGASHFGNAREAYHVAINTWNGAVTACEDVFATPGTSTSQILDTDDCRLGQRNADKVILYMKAGEKADITMRSTAFDAKVEVHQLLSGTYTMVASDDNGGGGTDALLTFTAPVSDYYWVYATSVANSVGGAYTLSIATTAGSVVPRMAAMTTVPGEAARLVKRSYTNGSKTDRLSKSKL